MEGKTVLFIGTGCYVGALKKIIKNRKIDDEKLVTIDLICHGTTFPEVEKQYIENLEKKYRSRVTSFSTRYKKEGWQMPYLQAKMDNGKVFEKPFYETDFGYVFQTYLKASCFDCKYKGDNHVSDLTLGDYWGIDRNAKGYNSNGVSIIFGRSQKGLDLIGKLNQNQFFLTEVPAEHAVDKNVMFYKSKKKSTDYERFKENLQKYGLHYAVKHSAGYWKYLKRKIKKTVKRLLK